jgi:hypothetical protein
VQEVTSCCSLVLATDKTLDDMDGPGRTMMAALQRLEAGSSRSNGIWAGASGGGGASGSGNDGASSSRGGGGAGGGRQLQLTHVGSSVGAVTRSSPLIRLSLCQTLTKPLSRSRLHSAGSESPEGASGSSGGGAAAGGSLARAGTTKALLSNAGSSSDGNLYGTAAAAAAPGGSAGGLPRPPVARHRRAHSSSSTGAVTGGDTLVSGLMGVPYDPLVTVASSSYASAAGSSGGGGVPGAGAGAGVALGAPLSVVNKAAIISFRKVELLVGTLDLNTDQVGCTRGTGDGLAWQIKVRPPALPAGFWLQLLAAAT